MSTMTQEVAYRDPVLGRIFVPQSARRVISVPGRPAGRAHLGEVGIVVMKHHKPVYRFGGTRHMHDQLCTTKTCEVMKAAVDGVTLEIEKYLLATHSITHNERVNIGAAAEAKVSFGAGTGAPAVTVNGLFQAIANASAVLTKAATDLSLGSATGGVATNEITTAGLARAAGTLGAYTAPAAFAVPGAPTVVNNAGGTGFTGGNYRFAVTFVTSAGTPAAETSSGTETGAIAITAGQGATWSNIPVGPAGTVARRLYRTAAGGATGTERLVTTINDNTTTTFTDNTTDATVAAAAVIPTTNTTALGATFSQVLSKLFTATGAITSQGTGVFDSVTVAGSNLYAEDNYTVAATLATNDTLTDQWTFTS
jgi:hypothetical protein